MRRDLARSFRRRFPSLSPFGEDPAAYVDASRSSSSYSSLDASAMDGSVV